MLGVSALVGKGASSGEEGIDLGKALIQTCNGCALWGRVLKAEKVAARPENSELPSVSKHIIDWKCREKSWRELTEWTEISLCVAERIPVLPLDVPAFWGICC